MRTRIVRQYCPKFSIFFSSLEIRFAGIQIRNPFLTNAKLETGGRFVGIRGNVKRWRVINTKGFIVDHRDKEEGLFGSSIMHPPPAKIRVFSLIILNKFVVACLLENMFSRRLKRRESCTVTHSMSAKYVSEWDDNALNGAKYT